jgi:hypothetical protein
LQVDDVTHGDIDEKAVPDSEGRKRLVQHVKYERSSKNRERAIEIHGTICEVCRFDFDETYGNNYADSYIQIHHIKPLSQYEGEVDPETDLVPLCANCHAMAHKRRKTVTSIEELKELIEKAKGQGSSASTACYFDNIARLGPRRPLMALGGSRRAPLPFWHELFSVQHSTCCSNNFQ